MEFKVPATGAEWRSAPRVCRCCLSEGCYKDISTEYYWMGEKETYAEMLKECFDLTISLQDAANSNGRLICEVCITRLRDATNFKKQVVRSEQRFAEHLQSGASLSTISVTEGGPYQEVKVEGVKDEMLVSDDDDVDDGPVDDDTLDPDYDESDSLPLKYEVQKKEALVELSFGDEIPTLSNTETTIRRVSAKGKDKSPAKKLKLNKKELTIKPVKASGSKVKAAKAPKAPKVPKAPKPAKPATKKGDKKGLTVVTPKVRVKVEAPVNPNTSILIEFSNACPFRWYINQYRCFICELTFFDIPQLRLHMQTGHSVEQMKIRISREPRGTPIKADIQGLHCNICPIPMDSVDSLQHHLYTIHGKLFVDDPNDALVPFRLDSETFNCQLCPAHFNSFHTLNQHMNTHFQNHICETCGAAFMNPVRLTIHKSRHKPTKFFCKICKIEFPSIHKKINHMSTEHKKDAYKCPHCPERFKEHYSRMSHLISHHGAPKQEFKCGSCEKSFRRKNTLNLHIRNVHLNERNYECEVCCHKFFQKNHLTKHMTSHGGERKYRCEICDKTYSRKDALMQHMKCHDNGNRFACSMCGLSFVQALSLRQHLRTHHPTLVEMSMSQ